MKKSIKLISIALIILTLCAIFIGCTPKDPKAYFDMLLNEKSERGMYYMAQLKEGDNFTYVIVDNKNIAVSNKVMSQGSEKENSCYFYMFEDNSYMRYQAIKDIDKGTITGTKKAVTEVDFNKGNIISAFSVNDLIFTKETINKIVENLTEVKGDWKIENSGTKFDGYTISIDVYGMMFEKDDITLILKQKASVVPTTLTGDNKYVLID